MEPNDKIDSIDKEILTKLFENSRISYAQLAEYVGLSRAGVTARVASLQRRGVIQRFTVDIPTEYVRKPLPAFFDIRVDPPALKEAGSRIAEHPDIVTVYQMSANNSLHVHGFFANLSDVSIFVEQFLIEIDGLQDVTTDFLLHRFKSDRV